MTDPLVLFMPSGKRGRFPIGTPVMEAARRLGVRVESVCGGRGACGACQIDVHSGRFAKHGITSTSRNLSAPAAKELEYAERRKLKPGRRLSCQATIQGDLVIDVPQDVTVNAQIVRKGTSGRTIDRSPAIRLCYTEVEVPDMQKPRGDAERLIEALCRDWGLERLGIEPSLLAGLQATLRSGRWTVTAAIHDDPQSGPPHIVALWPGLKNEAYGIACDIGSTTIAMHLVSLVSGRVAASAGAANPQIGFGEDLMSRVSYVMMNPGGRTELTAAVRGAINDLIAKVCGDADASAADILDAVFVGNPVMHHLFLGIDPTELGGAPFALAVSGPIHGRAADFELSINPNARLYVLPCIAGHVGADAAAAILAEGPHRQDEMMLLVDVGTNAEIVLGNRNRVVVCSSPTGPAFEGAEISSGQRAAPGAIERVRIDPATLEPRYRVIGVEPWSDEPGFEEAARAFGVTGICGSGIIEVMAEMFLAGLISEDGIINGALATRSSRVIPHGRTFSYVLRAGEPVISVTQADVRAVQLAKAALYAGVKLLMQKQGVTAVDRIHLAGAFGSFIDARYAMVLGLIPDCALDCVASVGNAAGEGALMALLNRDYRREIEDEVRRIEKIETALAPDFQSFFVEAMALPNKTDAFPKLAAAMGLPERTASSRRRTATGRPVP